MLPSGAVVGFAGDYAAVLGNCLDNSSVMRGLILQKLLYSGESQLSLDNSRVLKS